MGDAQIGDSIRPMEFVESRLNAILKYPWGWGPTESLEPQVLTLLELRALLIDHRARPDVVHSNYIAHVDRCVGGPSALSIANRLDGDRDQIIEILRSFSDAERARQNASGTQNIISLMYACARSAYQSACKAWDPRVRDGLLRDACVWQVRASAFFEMWKIYGNMIEIDPRCQRICGRFSADISALE